MRPHLFAANRCLLRLPALFRPYNSVLLSPSRRILLRKSNPQILSQNASFSSRFVRNLCVRATNVNDAGSIDSPLMQSMEKKIKDHLNAESVSVKDAYGDGRHVSIEVVSAAFEGQSAVNRQRMVYKAIWEELQSTVHAVDQMTTKTPAEASQ
ncbi:protein BOLA4, chloroplastic/mitochondrial [Neltuma alba]|uniref:protein BOLA4, chloroplastic/mitochondrial-like n=1 Tax=Neltuma alba TaxID=207710 RepID=UPI0010A45932|nr:protein BOLA4, chloroplastic/mitochondrial-like [Prosopis alba]XP_028783819.1 protein BOLA4, chloroplastic/mitochondrial-like [Prosopis alba]